MESFINNESKPQLPAEPKALEIENQQKALRSAMLFILQDDKRVSIMNPERIAVHNEVVQALKDCGVYQEDVIQNVDEFFDEVSIVDNNILLLEKEMGRKIDFTDPEMYEIFVKALYERELQCKKDFIQKCLESLKSKEVIFNSSTTFYAINHIEEQANFLNWPAKISSRNEFFYFFTIRFITRFFINELQKSGIFDENPLLEKVLLTAMPTTDGTSGGIKFENKELTRAIVERHLEAQKTLFASAQFPKIASIANDLYAKGEFFFTNHGLSRLSPKELEEYDKKAIDMGINPLLMKTRRDLDSKSWKQDLPYKLILYKFFGHETPYINELLRSFTKEDFMNETMEEIARSSGIVLNS